MLWNEGGRTPNLNKMASEGVLYRSACCTAPISSPSRSAMMTGVHQTIINAHNHRSNRNLPLDEKIQTHNILFKKSRIYLHTRQFQCHEQRQKTDCNFKHIPLGEWNGKDKFGLFDKYDEFTTEDQPFFAQVQLVVTHTEATGGRELQLNRNIL